MLARFGTLGAVAGAASGELARASGTGPAVWAELALLREFAVRLARDDACRRPVITSRTALVAYVRTALAHKPREQFRTLFLDRRNILLGDELVAHESAYRADARSPAGAACLTQLMPGTASELGVRNRFDPVENLRGGADYLARQIRHFGDLRRALAAYNAGPARVARLGRIPDIAETQAYVATVVDCYMALTAGQGITSSSQCRPRGQAENGFEVPSTGDGDLLTRAEASAFLAPLGIRMKPPPWRGCGRPAAAGRPVATYGPNPIIHGACCERGRCRRCPTSALPRRRRRGAGAVADLSIVCVDPAAPTGAGLRADPAANFAVKAVARRWARRDGVDPAIAARRLGGVRGGGQPDARRGIMTSEPEGGPVDTGGPEDRLLPWDRVRDVTGLSRSTAWRLQQVGDFQSPCASRPTGSAGGKAS